LVFSLGLFGQPALGDQRSLDLSQQRVRDYPPATNEVWAVDFFELNKPGDPPRLNAEQIADFTDTPVVDGRGL
jgi:hypothetical protein